MSFQNSYSYCMLLVSLFLNQARAGLWPAHAWFHKIVSVRMSVCVCVFVCVCVCVCRAAAERGATGAIFLGPTLLGAPYSPISLLSCSFQPQIATPACSFLLIRLKAHSSNIGALHHLLASSVIHQPPLDHHLNNNNF